MAQHNYLSPSAVEQALIAVMNHNYQLGLRNGRRDEYIILGLFGPTGSGKTSIVHQAAAKFRASQDIHFPVVYDRIADKAPEEISGYPKPDPDGLTFNRLGPKKWVKNSTAICGFLDEFAQGNTDQQNVARSIMNEGVVGDHPLPPGSTIIVASNLMSERAGTHSIPTHAKDCITFVYIRPHAPDWVNWAIKNGIGPEVISFIHIHGAEWLSKTDHTTDSTPSPRSWARVDSMLRMDITDSVKKALVAGMVGDGAALAFYAHKEKGMKMPDPDLVVADPLAKSWDGIRLSQVEKDSDIMYMLCCALSTRLNTRTAGNIIKWMHRVEHKAFCSWLLSMALERNPKLRMESPDVGEWLTKVDSRMLIG